MLPAMSFAAHEEQDRRLVLLRALQSAAQYRTNANLLQSYCRVVGHVASLDRIVADLGWLQEGGLLTLVSDSGVTVATLTVRGLDVAQGFAAHPGVAKPKPGA